jgi:hypothetical protein
MPSYVRWYWYDEIVARYHLLITLRATPTANGKQQAEIRRRLDSTLAISEVKEG